VGNVNILKIKIMKNYPMVTVECNSLPSYVCLLKEWVDGGGYKGFLKTFGISIKEIKSVKHEVLPASSYPQKAWEG
jgi:hypothetical protein